MKQQKVIIAYLYTKFDVIENLINFINFFIKNPPGHNHKLLICYKLLTKQQIVLLREKTKLINHTEFIDPVKLNDFDFGSYKRIAKLYPNFPIFFNLGHAYPIKKNWLKILMRHFDKRTLLASSGSNESIFSSVLRKKKLKIIFNLRNYFFLKKNFKEFPNPHIRSINFILYGSDFVDFVKDKKYFNKKDAWMSESGYIGMTNFFKKKKFKIYVVNSENNKFSIHQFKNSETYCYRRQSKKLFSDKHSRKFDIATNDEKLKIEKKVWS